MNKKNQKLQYLIKKKYKYQLLENGFSNKDISIGKNVLSSKRITMASHTKNFEVAFAKKLGAKYALMVNSGSSANLLATFAAGNPLKKNCLKRGDEVLIPALLWMILFSILMKNSRGLTYLLIFGTPVSIYFFGSEWFFWIYWNLFIPSIEFIDSIVTQNSIDTQN